MTEGGKPAEHPVRRRAKMVVRWYLALSAVSIALGVLLNVAIARSSSKAVEEAAERRAEVHRLHEEAMRAAMEELESRKIDSSSWSVRMNSVNGKWMADLGAVGAELNRKFARNNAWSRGVVLLWMGPGAGALLAFLIWSLLRMRAAGLRDGLVARGYEWVTLDDARWLLLVLRWRADRLPPAAEVEILPGITRDIDGLIAFDRMMRRHRAGGQSSRAT